MDSFFTIIEFFGGIFLLFAIGWFIGHLLKLDKIYEEMQIDLKSKNRKKTT